MSTPLRIIRDALGLAKNAAVGSNSGDNPIKNVIVDAEMVAFSNRLHKIDGAQVNIFSR